MKLSFLFNHPKVTPQSNKTEKAFMRHDYSEADYTEIFYSIKTKWNDCVFVGDPCFLVSMSETEGGSTCVLLQNKILTVQDLFIY